MQIIIVHIVLERIDNDETHLSKQTGDFLKEWMGIAQPLPQKQFMPSTIFNTNRI